MHRTFLVGMLLLWVTSPPHGTPAAEAMVSITTPMSPPEWALLERELLRANALACRRFFDKYFDARGYLLCVERWGGDDGPDDAIECLADWPLLHALGADDALLDMYHQGWEGHLRQYTEAKTTEVELARDGMYYQEFPVMFDWVHHGEGLTAFGFQGLSDPHDRRYQERVKRFASFYLGEDARAANYDPRHKIIRSLFNGSRGPLLRKATALDWAGDPIEIEGRFRPQHGEENYAQMLEHFRDYNDVVGDHPQNLCATSLATAAYMLTHEPKYKAWVLAYVDAWVERMNVNGGVIPTNIGLDGTIGGAAGGKWYGGVYGWGFTVRVPQTGELANRNMHHLGLVGFGNAMLLSGNQRYADAWRRQIETVNSHAKTVDGRMMFPRMHGDDGWYAFVPEPYAHGAREVYYWSMSTHDRMRLGDDAWLEFLDGRRPSYPEETLRADLDSIRRKVEAINQDPTTPDTRLADDPLVLSPVAVASLVNLTTGGIYPGHVGSPLHCRLRYFDPERRRAGLPEDVAALVEGLSDGDATLTLVNLNAVEPCRVVVQAGAYGEHQATSVTLGDRKMPVNHRFFTVELAPGAGGRIVVHMKRYTNDPTLAHPWD